MNRSLPELFQAQFSLVPPSIDQPQIEIRVISYSFGLPVAPALIRLLVFQLNK